LSKYFSTQAFKPKGEPLTSQQLFKLLDLTQPDLDRAIATAHPSLQTYLNAKPTRFNFR
jgi:hypothetical protein